MSGKIVVVTAPSGAGKSTLSAFLLKQFPQLYFSVSATTRPPRIGEQEGREYYFLTPGKFKELISRGDFLEWEQVYENTFYGSLKKELEKGWSQSKAVLFDIDVKGAQKLKAQFGRQALTLFIKPPSEQELIQRLVQRATETEESLQRRLKRIKEELSYEAYFDVVLVNDRLSDLFQAATRHVTAFLNMPNKPDE